MRQFPHSNSFRTVSNAYGTAVAVTPLSRYLTQIHLDFLVTLQELYGPGEMTISMKEVLAYCLGNARAVKWPTKAYGSVAHASKCTVIGKTLEVQWKQPLKENPEPIADRLVLEAFRISAETYLGLFQCGLLKSDVSILVPF